MIGTKEVCLKWLIDQRDGDFEVKEWHKKRSLTANGYYWSLLTQLALVLRTTSDELHPQLIQRYSVVDEDLPPITIKAGVDPARLPGYWKLIRTNGEWDAYVKLKGSSEMDSREFSRLLDGCIEECKDVGVETMPPAELERLRDYVA